MTGVAFFAAGLGLTWGFGLIFAGLVASAIVVARSRFGRRAALVGLLVALAVPAIGICLEAINDLSVLRFLQTAILLACPPSLGLMAVDSAPWPEVVLAVLAVALLNAGLYALIGTTLNWSWHKLRPGR